MRERRMVSASGAEWLVSYSHVWMDGFTPFLGRKRLRWGVYVREGKCPWMASDLSPRSRFRISAWLWLRRWLREH